MPVKGRGAIAATAHCSGNTVHLLLFSHPFPFHFCSCPDRMSCRARSGHNHGLMAADSQTSEERKLKRKQRRAAAKMAKKSETKALADKMFQFDKLGDSCLVCDAPFDKKSKEMAMTWTVVVREKENKVNLYCPTCWENAHKLIAQMKEELNENKNKET